MAKRTSSGDYVTELVLKTVRLNGRFLAVAEDITAGSGLTAARWQVLGAVLAAPLSVAEVARAMGSRGRAFSVWQMRWSMKGSARMPRIRRTSARSCCYRQRQGFRPSRASAPCKAIGQIGWAQTWESERSAA
ncbi:hypothetical protein BH09MYX1_BH09MYX1_51560 [soil metagenome]